MIGSLAIELREQTTRNHGWRPGPHRLQLKIASVNSSSTSLPAAFSKIGNLGKLQ